jgi:hypothetical protein
VVLGAESALLVAALKAIATEPLRATVYVIVWLFVPDLPPPAKAAVGGMVAVMVMVADVDAVSPAVLVTRNVITYLPGLKLAVNVGRVLFPAGCRWSRIGSPIVREFRDCLPVRSTSTAECNSPIEERRGQCIQNTVAKPWQNLLH